MIVVLVFWQIHDNEKAVVAFKKWWEDHPIEDRSGLIGEYLSEPRTENLDFDIADPPPWVTTDKPTRPFVNVAIWRDTDSFHDQVGKYMGEKQPFEVVYRQRVVVEHIKSRRGAWGFPGVLDDEVQWK